MENNKKTILKLQRQREEYKKQKKFFTKDNCPFCTNLNKNKIIFESEFWIVMPNDNPYFGDINGLMVFPKAHKKYTIELSYKEFGDFLKVEKFMENFYKEKEYFSFVRQSKSNRSVEHLHYHYLVGKVSTKIIDGENYFKIKDGYKKIVNIN